MTASWKLWLDVATGERPLVLNRERKLHWSSRSQAVLDWGNATHSELARLGVRRVELSRVGFEFHPVYPGGTLPDTGSVFPTTKAIVDAIVWHGVIPDDNPWHNAWETQHAPHVNPNLTAPMIVVSITEVDPVDGHLRGDCDCRRRYERALVKSGR